MNDGYKDIYLPIDMHNNEIVRVSIEKLASDPQAGQLFAGRIWFNTTDARLRIYDGSSVRNIKYLEETAQWATIEW